MYLKRKPINCDDYEMRIIMNIILATKESLNQEV